MQIRAAVIGAGSWGTTVAHLLAHNVDRAVGPRSRGGRRGRHRAHQQPLPGRLRPAPGPAGHVRLVEAVRQADLLVMGVPSHGFRSTLERGAPSTCGPGCRWSASPRASSRAPAAHDRGHQRGAARPSLRRAHRAEPGQGDPGRRRRRRGAGHERPHDRRELQELFATDLFRVYTNPDVIGCEVAGALKNVMAIASGMADGLGTGDNTRAAVITRGLARADPARRGHGRRRAHLQRPGRHGRPGRHLHRPQSRNRHVGEQLGKGRTIDEIIDEMNMVAEGVKTAAVVHGAGRASTASTCRSPSRCTASSRGPPGRPRPTAGCSGRTVRHEMHGLDRQA